MSSRTKCNVITHLRQSYFIPTDHQKEIAARCGIVLGKTGKLPKGTKVQFLLNGDQLITAETNAYGSASSKELRTWFMQRNAGASFETSVGTDGKIILKWA